MNTKLTLKLNQEIIERAKLYASNRKLSLSGLIENYLNALTSEVNRGDDLQISPFVKSMSTGTKIPAGLDYKKEYSDFLTEKHK